MSLMTDIIIEFVTYDVLPKHSSTAHLFTAI